MGRHTFKGNYIPVRPTIQAHNIAAIKLIQNPQFFRKSKHIDIRYMFIRDTYEKKEINYEYVPTEKQAADYLTKALARHTFEVQKRLSCLQAWPHSQKQSYA